MREMVITAFTKSREDRDRLARDIAAAEHDGDTVPAAIESLHERFRELQAASTEHAQLLNTSLDDITAGLKLVNAQLASRLARAS